MYYFRICNFNRTRASGSWTTNSAPAGITANVLASSPTQWSAQLVNQTSSAATYTVTASAGAVRPAPSRFSSPSRRATRATEATSQPFATIGIRQTLAYNFDTGAYSWTDGNNAVVAASASHQRVRSRRHLHLDGGRATGLTGLRITPAGGSGAVTTFNGIQVVDANNGGSTAPGAFVLSHRVVEGPYEYQLARSSIDASNPEAWYLRSQRTIFPPPAPPLLPPAAPPWCSAECGGGTAAPRLQFLCDRRLAVSPRGWRVFGQPASRR